MWLKSQRSLGLFLLAVWLIVNGLRQAISLHFLGLDFLLGILALIAGALLLIGR